MNLYNLHEDPQSLRYFRETPEIVPDLFWDKYRNKPEELKAREKAISKAVKFASLYALDVLNSPFPAGEAAIAADAGYAYLYALDVLKGPFPAGEEAITKSAEYTYNYTASVLSLKMPVADINATLSTNH